ncbi:hypothetical protein IQ06DRAFT_305225 [Phaeosphaeriaceae sp. SRC1lsM3a]|nr:hypothetical protein IQ06DRAFT_305225 [Stagonospora sp. SRC1lsM3a]
MSQQRTSSRQARHNTVGQSHVQAPNTNNTSTVTRKDSVMASASQTPALCDRDMLPSQRRQRGDMTAYEVPYQPNFVPRSSLHQTPSVLLPILSRTSSASSDTVDTTSGAAPRRSSVIVRMFDFAPGADMLFTISRSTSGASKKSNPSESQHEPRSDEEVGKNKAPPTTFEEILGPRREATALKEE